MYVLTTYNYFSEMLEEKQILQTKKNVLGTGVRITLWFTYRSILYVDRIYIEINYLVSRPINKLLP